MVRVRTVEPLDGFYVRLAFSDNTEKVLNLELYLNGPIFEPLRKDTRLFRSVTVDPELGTIVWPNGADIDPDVLHGTFMPAWMEEQKHNVS